MRTNDQEGYCELCQRWLRRGEGTTFYRSENAIMIDGSRYDDIPNVQTGRILQCLDREQCKRRTEILKSGKRDESAEAPPAVPSLSETWSRYGLRNEGEE